MPHHCPPDVSNGDDIDADDDLAVVADAAPAFALPALDVEDDADDDDDDADDADDADAGAAECSAIVM